MTKACAPLRRSATRACTNGSGRTVCRLIEPASPGSAPCPSRPLNENWGIRMARALLLGGIAATALASPDFALAQTPNPSDAQTTAANAQGQASSRVTAYDAAYFAQFAPRTALDIARHVPGF